MRNHGPLKLPAIVVKTPTPAQQNQIFIAGASNPIWS